MRTRRTALSGSSRNGCPDALVARGGGGRIVMNDHVAVACGMDVELDTVRAEGQRAFERGEGILQSLS